MPPSKCSMPLRHQRRGVHIPGAGARRYLDLLLEQYRRTHHRSGSRRPSRRAATSDAALLMTGCIDDRRARADSRRRLRVRSLRGRQNLSHHFGEHDRHLVELWTGTRCQTGMLLGDATESMIRDRSRCRDGDRSSLKMFTAVVVEVIPLNALVARMRTTRYAVSKASSTSFMSRNTLKDPGDISWVTAIKCRSGRRWRAASDSVINEGKAGRVREQDDRLQASVCCPRISTWMPRPLSSS